MSDKYQVWMIAQAMRNEQLVVLCQMALAVVAAYLLIGFYPVRWQRYARPAAQALGLVVFVVTLMMSLL